MAQNQNINQIRKASPGISPQQALRQASVSANRENIAMPATGINRYQAIRDLLNERRNQRKVLFRFAVFSAIITQIFLISIVIGQGLYRAFGPNKDFLILENFGIETLAVSIFGQFISVILVITNAVWDSRELEYLN